MGLLDLNKAQARKTVALQRRDCKTYDDAYAYFQYNVEQWKKYEDVSEIPIFNKKTDKNGNVTEIFLELSLHQMPLYWDVEPILDSQGNQVKKIVKKWDGNALVENYQMDDFKGKPMYPIADEEEGWNIIQSLASEEDADFKAVLTRAAQAMCAVEEELQEINKYAEVLYNESEWSEKYGEWDAQDAGTKQSTQKQQKKSQFKQTARRRLGYQRATDKGTKLV